MEHDHSETLQRFKTVEGHVRGIQRMLENETYCVDIIRQIQAVHASLDKISLRILDQHLNSCLVTAVQGNDSAERERVLKEIVDLFETNRKI